MANATFNIGGTRFSLEIEVRPAQQAKDAASEKGMRTIDLQPVPPEAMRLSISGTASSGSGGQIVHTLRTAAEGYGVDVVEELCSIWDRWHLNDLKAGTRAQMQYLETLPSVTEYTAKKAALLEAGLEPDGNTNQDMPYSYGTGWLFEVIPAAVLERLEELRKALDGQTFGMPEIDDLPEFSSTDDTLNSSDIIARVDGLRAYLEAHGVDLKSGPAAEESEAYELWDIFEEWKELDAFASEAESYCADWEYGETLINDSHFEEYAQQLAEDIGAVDRNAKWPNNCIDWAAAASELKGDYTAVEFKGETFWIR